MTRAFWVRVLFLFAVVVGVNLWQTKNMPSGMAAVMSLPQLADHVMRDVPSGSSQVELLYFFAPWCSVCKASAANAEALLRWFPNLRITYVALDFEREQDVQDFVRDQKIGSSVVLGHLAFQRQWHIDSYPTYAVINRDGVVSSFSVGYSTLPGLAARVGFASF